MRGVTKISHLALVVLIAGVSGWVVGLSLYGSLPKISWSNSLLLWLMAVACSWAAWNIRKRIAEGGIGMDRSQWSPVLVANWMLVGKATAWIGAAFAGIYVGLCVYVWPLAGDVIAAGEDLPGVVITAVAGFIASAAGVYLERQCLVPPQQLDQAVEA